jgi:hypothetical protein
VGEGIRKKVFELLVMMMADPTKKRFHLRTVLAPHRMPESKIPREKLAELARRTTEWERRQAVKPK